MYHRTVKLSFKSFMSALMAVTLLATALLAPFVRAQKQNERPEFRKLRPDDFKFLQQQLKEKREEMRTQLNDLRTRLIQQKQQMMSELAASEESGGSSSSRTENARTATAKNPAPDATTKSRTIVVTSTGDDGPGSLRQALAMAADGDTINITAMGTIALVRGELIVDKSVNIRGPGKTRGSVSGNGASRVFHIMPGTTVTISGLTIADGTARSGGGIYNDHAKLTLKGCVVTGNSARFGGGIFSNGFSGNATLLLITSTISSNSAIIAGGAIFNNGFSGSATLAVTSSVISGNNTTNDFNLAFGGGIYNNGDSGAATVVLTNTTVNQNNSGLGGGIFNDGSSSFSVGNATLTASHSTVSNNSSEGGCGIYNLGGGSLNFPYVYGNATVALSNCDISGNTASECFSTGGGINNSGELGNARVTLTNTTVSDNHANVGGGIENTGIVTLNNSIVSSNSAFCDTNFGKGGGIDADRGATTIINNSSITDNSASAPPFTIATGGGISNENSSLIVTDSTISGNSASSALAAEGGGIFSIASSGTTATVTIINTTISGNSAVAPVSAAGAISNIGDSGAQSTVALINSTISGNLNPLNGGIFNGSLFSGVAALTLNNSTVSGNQGVAISNAVGFEGSAATIGIANTILNGDGSGQNIFNDSGTIISYGYNLSSDAAGGDGSTGPDGLLNGPGDIRNTDPQLGPLQDNGGPTLTHALLLNSPAIDAGDPNFNPNAFVPPLVYDQRGGPGFPRVVKGRIDIGAFESKHP